ncbi:MAG: glycosyltransferase family 2 protein [Deltaproteobacteria bacterium]|nr:glycosyltransferase family 2 protein [Deltaproteobacteria bacterium]
MKFALLIPAHNVETRIGEVLAGAGKWLADILVVDDGSTDKTAEIARRQGVRVLSDHPNRGKGWALKRGFDILLKEAPEAILTMDGDGQHDPDCLPLFLEAYRRGAGDVIIGSRMGHRDEIPRLRYYPNLVGTYCLSWATGQYIPDSQSGFRLYGARGLEGLCLVADGFALETELLIKLAKKGSRIASLPIPAIYSRNGQASHYRPVADTYQISIMVLRSIFWPRQTRRNKGIFFLPFRERKRGL